MSDLDILQTDYDLDFPTAAIDDPPQPPHPPIRPLDLYTPELHAFLTIIDTQHNALSCAEAEICQNIDSLRTTLHTLFDEEQKGERTIDANLKAACEANFEALEASFRDAFRQMIKFEGEREGACRRAVLGELEKTVKLAHRIVWGRVRRMADLVAHVRTGDRPPEGDVVRVKTGEEK